MELYSVLQTLNCMVIYAVQHLITIEMSQTLSWNTENNGINESFI